MPEPKSGEKQNDFISRCIKQVMNEGNTQEQAQGKCYGIWRNAKKSQTRKAIFKALTGLLQYVTKQKAGVPKKDGSGEGKRKNKGRGGCDETEQKGKGANK